MLSAPAPEELVLPVFKLFTSVQFVPLYNSVLAVLPPPEKLNAEVCVPSCHIELAACKSFTSVQLVPFHDSVVAELPGC